MNAGERRDLARARTLLLAGERAKALDVVRLLLRTPEREAFNGSPQVAFAFTEFRCATLAEENVPAHVCVARQLASDAARTKDTWRGTASPYPSCRTETCEQGRRVRAQLGAAALSACVRIAAREKNGHDLSPSQKLQQTAARKRMEREGLLDPTPSLDGGPEPVAE